MYSGEFWLDYDDQDEEDHWQGRVTRLIIRNGQIVIEFTGHDVDRGVFHGSCNLHRQGPLFVGNGVFIVGRDRRTASVSATFTQNGNEASLSGSWQESGENAVYDITMDLVAS